MWSRVETGPACSPFFRGRGRRPSSAKRWDQDGGHSGSRIGRVLDFIVADRRGDREPGGRPASIAVAGRHRRAETERDRRRDAVRTLMAWGGERRVVRWLARRAGGRGSRRPTRGAARRPRNAFSIPIGSRAAQRPGGRGSATASARLFEEPGAANRRRPRAAADVKGGNPAGARSVAVATRQLAAVERAAARSSARKPRADSAAAAAPQAQGDGAGVRSAAWLEDPFSQFRQPTAGSGDGGWRPALAERRRRTGSGHLEVGNRRLRRDDDRAWPAVAGATSRIGVEPLVSGAGRRREGTGPPDRHRGAAAAVVALRRYATQGVVPRAPSSRRHDPMVDPTPARRQRWSTTGPIPAKLKLNATASPDRAGGDRGFSWGRNTPLNRMVPANPSPTPRSTRGLWCEPNKLDRT